jgi:LysR substrate binding domain
MSNLPNSPTTAVTTAAATPGSARSAWTVSARRPSPRSALDRGAGRFDRDPALLEQHGAGRGQGDPSAGALEQPYAELAFELADGGRQRRLGHPGGPAAAVRGGAADVAILRAPFDQRGLDTELLLTEPRVAVLPAHHCLAGRTELRRADLVFVPVTDLSPSEVVAAWSGTSRSRAVAAFVRAAVEVAADHAESTPALA